MPRFLVIGCSGAGKSFTARSIARILQIPYIDTDAMYWRSGWSAVPGAEVVKGLPLESDSWAIDGNFADFRDRVWKRADHIIWLNFSLLQIFSRVAARNLRWWITQNPTWSGNKMSLAFAISGIRYSWRQYFRLRRTFPKFLEEFEEKDIRILRSSRDLEAFLAGLKQHPTI